MKKTEQFAEKNAVHYTGWRTVPESVGLKGLTWYRSLEYENKYCPEDGGGMLLSNIYASTHTRRHVPGEIIVLNIMLFVVVIFCAMSLVFLQI